MGTVFINAFEIPAERDAEFLALFREVNDHMRAQPGYLAHRMHRALAPDARFRYVNVVQWESPAAVREAHGDAFRAIVSRPEWGFVKSTPAVYEVIDAAGEVG